MAKQFVVLVVVIAVLAAFAVTIPASAQDTPSVTVSDQVSLDGTVTVDSVVSDGPGFIVIHADANGAPGPGIGFRQVNPGANSNVVVPIDPAAATPVLYAMLHADTGEAGVYEFGTVEGADLPVMVADAPVSPAFNVNILHATDQFVTDGQVRIAHVTVAAPTWVTIHAGDAASFGPVLGQTLVQPGTTADVMVALTGDVTPVLWPMLHSDTGEAGVYEFGTVEGADPPVAFNGQVATFPIWTVPHVRMDDQIAVHGDGFDMTGMEGVAPTVTAASVLSQGPGFLVIHSDDNGGPGPVLGFTPVPDGLSTNVTVELSTEGLTPVLWPMLHVDTGEVGVYEFGTVEGADSPAMAGDQPVTFSIMAAPSLRMSDQALENNTLLIEAALIDAPGWIAIHSSQDGGPGPVIASYPLAAGLTRNIRIEVDPAQAGTQVFPMLHYDTGEPGVYEFGTVEGADGPVSVGGNVVVGPLNLMAGGAAPAATEEAAPAETEAPSTGGLDGNALINERCTVCHTRERIDAQDKDEAGWTATVERMIGYGAQLNEEERQAVIEYLVATH